MANLPWSLHNQVRWLPLASVNKAVSVSK